MYGEAMESNEYKLEEIKILNLKTGLDTALGQLDPRLTEKLIMY
jgi:hypothetical protein